MPQETIGFDERKGPLTIEVTSGFVSRGSFVLAYKRPGDDTYTEFGPPEKRIDDDIPDLYLIPLDPSALNESRLVIMGKYSPAPGHTQIMVNYIFIQDATEIHTTAILKKTKKEFERFNHRYKFKAE